MSNANPIRILIADHEYQQARSLAQYLTEKGFSTRVVSNCKEARQEILSWKPRFVMADLTTPDGGALALIDFIKGEPTLKHNTIHVFVMSGHNTASNVKQALTRGAKDYLVKPYRNEDVYKRVVFHARGTRQLLEISQKEFTKVDEASLMLHLTDLVLRQALGAHRLEDILFNLTRMVSMKVDGVRCSIVHCLDQRVGFVVTSNDSRQATGIELDLYKYPEIIHVLNTQSPIAIENLSQNAELKHVREFAKDIVFNSMVVCPVSRFGQPFGVLSLRMPPEKETVSDNEIRFVEIVSHVVSLVLSNELHKESGEFWRKTQPAPPVVVPFKVNKNS